jgi:hypothetical protein
MASVQKKTPQVSRMGSLAAFDWFVVAIGAGLWINVSQTR